MLADRTFGLIFAAIFLLIGLVPLLFSAQLNRWAIVVSLVFVIPSLIYPKILRPLNILWLKFGMLMHRVINPVLMGLVFFITVVPTGLLLKLFGKDPMRRKFEADTDTYWIEREDPINPKDTFNNQF